MSDPSSICRRINALRARIGAYEALHRTAESRRRTANRALRLRFTIGKLVDRHVRREPKDRHKNVLRDLAEKLEWGEASVTQHRQFYRAMRERRRKFLAPMRQGVSWRGSRNKLPRLRRRRFTSKTT